MAHGEGSVEHDYDTAKTYFKAILDSNVYSLTPHIGHNFNIENEMNSESIFEVAFYFALPVSCPTLLLWVDDASWMVLLRRGCNG